MKKTTWFAPAVLIATLAGFGAVARAATLECYFDFTRYGSVTRGATIVSNVHGTTAATLKSVGTTLNQWGLTTEPGFGASETGVQIAGETLAAYTGDFTIQIWYVTSETVSANTMLFGGTTSRIMDESLVGDQAFFVGHNHVGDHTDFVRPVVADGSRWGLAMTSVTKGTGTNVLSLQDYVITYNSAERVMTAYMNGMRVGSMNNVSLAGLAALSKGFSIGGVEGSAFKDDSSAPVNIRSFLIYSGVLNPNQIAELHLAGASAGLDALKSAQVVVN